MQYLVVIERSETGFGAYVPDLPGCIAAGESREEVVALIQEAIEFHIDGLKRSGDLIPEPVPKVSSLTFLPPDKSLHPTIEPALRCRSRQTASSAVELRR